MMYQQQVDGPERQHDLLILVDATASMGEYLSALRNSLPQILAVSALTGTFSRIGLLAYRDYDQEASDIIEWSGWQDNNEPRGVDIIEKAANIRLLGGNSWPEALKTGLAKAHEEMREEAETLILLYADAPPHRLDGQLDNDAQAEQDALAQPGSYGNSGTAFREWPSACKAIASKARVISILHPGMAPEDLIYFAWLSRATGGAAMVMNKENRLEKAISQVTMDILLTWMGAAETGPDNTYQTLASCIAFPFLQQMEQGSMNEKRLRCEGKKQLVRETLTPGHIPRKPIPVPSFAKQYKESSAYRENVTRQLQQIIEVDVGAISLNPVFGSLWRAVCNDRNSEQRDSLVSAFGTAIDRLTDITEKDRVKEWLEQSYNFTTEVLIAIEEVPQDQRYSCVCSDPTLDFAALPPENNDELHGPLDSAEFTRPDLLEIGRSCDSRILRRLGKCLTRLTYINSESELSSHLANSGLGKVPLIPLALSRNEHGRKFWKIILHLVVSGTMLSARPAALLAALTIKMGVRPLMNIAVKEVMFWRDRWTDNLDYPETWNISCLSLLLDANRAYRRSEELKLAFDGQDLLKEDDIQLFEKLIAFKMLETNLDTTLTAEVGWTPDRTRLPIGPAVRCVCCEKLRSVTIMGPDSVCGLCTPEITAKGMKQATDGLDISEQDEPAWVSCSLKGCRAQYVVYRSHCLNVRPKCFYCRSLGSNPGAETAPLIECTKCFNRMIYPEEYRPEGFRFDAWRCVACESGRETIVVSGTTARELIAENGKSWLLGDEGPLTVTFGAHHSLFHTVSALGLESATALSILPSTCQNLVLAGKPLHNTTHVLKQLQEWISNRKVEKGTCTLCFSESRKSELHPACGRSGCAQRLDRTCLSSWYGLNRPGHTINTAALHCPFCRRAPTAKTLASYGMGVHALQDLALAVDDAAWIWAWCQDCGSAKRYVERVCAAGIPNLREWRCDACTPAQSGDKDEPGNRIMPCPGCQQPTEKMGGCNHIRCTICDSHWCFVCGWSGSESNIYQHMSKDHGGYFDEGLEPGVDEMDWESDAE